MYLNAPGLSFLPVKFNERVYVTGAAGCIYLFRCGFLARVEEGQVTK